MSAAAHKNGALAFHKTVTRSKDRVSFAMVSYYRIKRAS